MFDGIKVGWDFIEQGPVTPMVSHCCQQEGPAGLIAKKSPPGYFLVFLKKKKLKTTKFNIVSECTISNVTKTWSGQNKK